MVNVVSKRQVAIYMELNGQSYFFYLGVFRYFMLLVLLG